MSTETSSVTPLVNPASLVSRLTTALLGLVGLALSLPALVPGASVAQASELGGWAAIAGAAIPAAGDDTNLMLPVILGVAGGIVIVAGVVVFIVHRNRHR